MAAVLPGYSADMFVVSNADATLVVGKLPKDTQTTGIQCSVPTSPMAAVLPGYSAAMFVVSNTDATLAVGKLPKNTQTTGI